MFGFITSLFLAIGISIVFNFSMNRNVTFSAKGQPIKKQLPKYLLVYSTGAGANFFMALFIKSILGEGFLTENLALLAGLAVSVPISFFGSLLWAFKKDCKIH